MDASSLLLPRRVPTKIADLVVDALVRESESLQNQVTDFPVEDGSAISDHIRPQPDKLTLECLVTNAPIRVVGVLGREPNNSITANANSVGEDLSFAEQALKYLRGLREARTLITVSNKRGLYSDMAVESIERNYTRDVGDALAFTIVLKRVRKVRLQFVDVPKSRVKSERARSRLDAGKNQAAQADDKTQGATATILDNLFFGGQ